jgi:hypothetical protein
MLRGLPTVEKKGTLNYEKIALLKMNLMAEYRVELAMTLALISWGSGLSLLSPQFLTVGNFGICYGRPLP